MRRRSRAETVAAHRPGLDDLTKAERRILKLIAEKNFTGGKVKPTKTFAAARPVAAEN